MEQTNQLAVRAPEARRALALLLALNLLCYMDRYILSAVAPEIRKAFFTGDDAGAYESIGWLFTAFLLSYLITAPIFGWMADRWSRWTIIAFGVAVWSVASAGSGFANTFAFLLISRIFVGVGEAAYGPAAPTLLADLFPPQRRGVILAWFFAAIPVGSALGYILGGSASAAWGWRSPFFIVAAPGILLAGVCLLLKDQRPKQPVQQKQSAIKDYRELFRTRSYVLNVAAQTAMTFAIGGMSCWAPTYFHVERGQADLEHINLIFGGITAVAGLLATLTGGWLGDFFEKKYKGAYFYVSGGGMLLSFPSTIAMLYAPFPLAWVFCFLAIFFLFFNIGPANTAIANVTRPAVRASAFALNIFVIHALGDAISPPLIGAIADRSSLSLGFLVVSLAMLLAGILWIIGARWLARDVERVGGI